MKNFLENSTDHIIEKEIFDIQNRIERHFRVALFSLLS